MQKRMWNMLPTTFLYVTSWFQQSHMDFATTLAKTMMIVRVVMVNSLRKKKCSDCLRPPLLLVHAHFIYVGRRKIMYIVHFPFILYSNFLSSSVKNVGSFFVRITYICHIPSVLGFPFSVSFFPCRTAGREAVQKVRR